MNVRNIKTGVIEQMRHGPATDAVTAGTHEFVNLDDNGDVKVEVKKEAKAKAGK